MMNPQLMLVFFEQREFDDILPILWGMDQSEVSFLISGQGGHTMIRLIPKRCGRRRRVPSDRSIFVFGTC